MRKTSRIILAVSMAAIFTSRWAMADDQLPPTIQSPPGATNQAKPKAAKPKATTASKSKKSASKSTRSAASEPSLPLTPGPAVVKQENVNVRAQAAINSEVVGKLHKNDQVTVLEEVTIKKPTTDEPAKWAKISLPTNSAVWINAHFIDPNDKTVKASKLNLRSGPGENYSVIGRVDKGARIQEIEARGDWLKIEPPANAYAFVAAHLLRSETSGMAIASATRSEKPLQTAAVESPAPVALGTEPAKPPTNETPTAGTPSQAGGAPTSASDASSQPPPEEEIKRVVTREGIVRRTVSIQAPTYFVLQSLDTGRPINYLYSTNIALKDFQFHRIVVTGEEMLDERWPNTPVITVDKLEVP